ncbi:MAG: hypothetical protein WD425_07540 [Nitrospirales bacterium]
MLNRYRYFRTYSSCIHVIVFGAMLLSPAVGVADDLSSHQPQSSTTESANMSAEEPLSLGHRHIQGTVEEVNENTIKVDAGEAGKLSPRYLNLENTNGNEDLMKGDLLQLEVNAQNKIVKYKKIEAKTKDTTR